MNCLHCKQSMPSNNVQQGQMHMGCYNEEIEVFKISLEGSSYLDDHLPDDIEDYEVEKVLIARGAFHYMKEFEGF